ncbi:hypothetical protein B7494_g2759 [Chlorociboria aeruginascens]|nr:hypothetical protein B7494_g2759 [Chlorociboria aeruginascens]
MSEHDFEQVDTPVDTPTSSADTEVIQNSKDHLVNMIIQAIKRIQRLEQGAKKSSPSSLKLEATHEIGGDHLDQKASKQGQPISLSKMPGRAPIEAATNVETLPPAPLAPKFTPSAPPSPPAPKSTGPAPPDIPTPQFPPPSVPKPLDFGFAKSAVTTVYCPGPCSQAQRPKIQLQPYSPRAATWVPYTDFQFMIAPDTKWPIVVLDTAHQMALDLFPRGRTAFDFFGWAFETFFQYRLEAEATPKKLEFAAQLRGAWKWAGQQLEAHKDIWARGEFTEEVGNCTVTVIRLLNLMLLFGQEVTIKWGMAGDSTWTGVLLRASFMRCNECSIGPWMIASDEVHLEGAGEVPLTVDFDIRELFISVHFNVEEQLTEEQLFPEV